MSWDEVSGSVCPVGRSLALVGDRWTLLILRELGMGTHRFDELQAQTGMSSHLLTTRLKRLERDGIVERRQYSARPLRWEYHATAKGKELDPILMMLRSWGRKWEGDCPPGEPSCRLVHKKSGAELDHLWQVPPEDLPTFTFDDVEATMGDTFKAEREGRRASFQAAQSAARKRAAKPGAKGRADK